MRITTLSTLVMGLILTFLASCATKEEKPKGVTEQEVYELAEKNLNSNSWLAATKALQLLEENFPFGAYAEQAQLELIYAHYRAQDYEDVIANADRFIRLHPQHRNVDYAYYMRGLASFYQDDHSLAALFGSDEADRDRGAVQDSFNALSQFLRKFPESGYARDAQQRLIYLRNILARSEIHAANYYFKRGAFLAAAKRGAFVVENFQGTPAVPDGLAVMAQAYYELNLEELADKAVALLASNFPNHPALDKSGHFDKSYYRQRKPRDWFSYVTLGIFDRAELAGFDSRHLYNSIYNPNKDLRPQAVQ